jgi:glutaredoxin
VKALLVLALLGAGGYKGYGYYQARNAAREAARLAERLAPDNQVDVYTAASCPKEGAVVAGLRARGIPFQVHDIEKDPRLMTQVLQRVAAKGVRNVNLQGPVAVVNGEVLDRTRLGEVEKHLRYTPE